MTSFEWIELILTVCATVIFGTLLIRFLLARKHLFLIPEYKKSHKRTELRLINSILQDMRDNPSDWITTTYDPLSLKPPHIINDKKNMAVLISENDEITIKMNLKEAHKYIEHTEDMIATRIRGEHVKKFKRGVDEYIDTRGKELSFIEDMLKKRL